MKTKTKQLFTLLLFLIIAGTTRAQDELKFTLAEAQSYALEHSYTVQNSGLDVAAARKKVWETIAIGLPQISGKASYTKNLNLPVSLIPGEFFGQDSGTYVPVKFGQDYNSDFGFSVNQLIFDGSYIVGIGSAKIYLQMATETKEKTEIEIKHAVAQSYFMVLTAEANLAVMRENLANSRKLEKDTKAMYENGFVEEQDVDQMRLLVQKAENEISKAEREIKIARVVLKYTMGLDVSNPIELTQSLDDFVEPLLARDEFQGGFDFSKHIDYRLLDTQREISMKQLKLAKAAYLPTLSAFYNWQKTAYGNSANLFKNSVPWFRSSMIGLNISVPIFTSGQQMARVSQAKMAYQQAENNQLQAQQSLQKDYLSAVANIESAVDQYENDVDNKRLAKKIYDKTTIKYNNGISSSIELSQTETQYIQAQGTWVAGVIQLLNSKIDLDKAIGKL